MDRIGQTGRARENVLGKSPEAPLHLHKSLIYRDGAGSELAFFDAPRQQIRSGRGKDGCKQPKIRAYVCENMCDFFFFSWERAI